MLHVTTEKSSKVNLFDGLEPSRSHHVTDEALCDHFIVEELAFNSDRLFAGLLLNHFIAFECDGALHLPAIHCLFNEFLAQNERQFLRPECGDCVVGVSILAVLYQLHRRADAVGHFTDQVADTCGEDSKFELKLFPNRDLRNFFSSRSREFSKNCQKIR